MRPGRRTAFLVCFAAILAYEGYALFIHEAGLTSHLPPARDLHLTREINATTSPLSQTFVMHAEGFRGIELYPRPSAQAPVGPLEATLSLLLDDNGRLPIARVARDSVALDLAGAVTIDFPRVDQSAGVAYAIDLRLPQAPPGHGLRFEAGGPTYVQGAMDIGGRREWGDLKFRTQAQRTTVFRNIHRMRQSLPPLLRTDVVWIGLLVLINWAMGTVLYYLAFAPDPDDASPPPSRIARTAPMRWLRPRQRPNGSAAVTADQPRV